jgi:hypothetical protein
MAIDGGLRTLFRNKLQVGWHWQSIETGGTGLGVPDSNFCFGGVEGWVEFKQTDGWTVDLRTEQISWLTTRHERGGRVFVAVRRKNQGGPRRGDPVDELWLWPGSLARRLKVEGLRIDEPCLYLGEGGPARWEWKKIGMFLSAKKSFEE